MIVYVLVFAALTVFLAACYGAYTWAMKAGDPFGPENNPDQAPLGTMPPEIAHEPSRPSIHELPPLGDAVWHQYPLTSPAIHSSSPPVCPGTGAGGPGTAAAAGDLRPPESPPPLPDPAYAAANPTAYPLEWLLSDTFVTGLTAIKDGAP